ncbi:hypothetical protein VP150E351_P0147 [Vibrio phage 150E35-1]|nr:hypothetical protein VP150E351_P0147 [Vibrio phage 150E35-1]
MNQLNWFSALTELWDVLTLKDYSSRESLQGVYEQQGNCLVHC